MTEYMYTVIREYPDGSWGKRKRKYYSSKPKLKVGELYVHLGSGFPGMHRVLAVGTEEWPDWG